MAKVHVTAKRDFLETLAAAPRPVAALAELVWNGFDADSSRVQIFLHRNALDAIESIRIRDNGYGINRSSIDSFFGGLGDSWKKKQGRQNGRALHGKNGKGRFKAFALGEKVEWETTFKDAGIAYAYKTFGNAKTLDDFEVTEATLAPNEETGTDVCIYNLHRDFRSLSGEDAPLELARIFAAYLTEYPELSLEVDGIRVDPKTVQSHRSDYNLGDIELSGNKKTAVSVAIIEWKIPTDRAIHLCDENGVALHELQAGPQIRAPGFNFTAYIKSDHFRELDKLNLLCLSDLHADAQKIITSARSKIKSHFRSRLLENQSQVIEKWKKQDIYPYEDKTTLDPIETAERQVFDIIAINVENYLPSFEDSDHKSKKFTFRLLSQAIRENPDSVQTIIAEVLGLKKDEQDDLAALLGRTSLSSIISSAKIVANRLDFLNGIESLLFDKESKDSLLERDQLHKILENESWLFHEEFSLAGSEDRLNDVLEKHIALLGNRADTTDPVLLPNGKTGRIDLLLHKVVQPRAGEYDYLVVELKRPSKKIDSEVVTQIKNYAFAVVGDERFHSVPTKWTFLAVSNDLDGYAQREANQRDRPKGQIHDDASLNCTVWVKSWADLINDARSRLLFINQHLSYEADRDSAKDYLQKAHARFIPDFDGIDPDDDPGN